MCCSVLQKDKTIDTHLDDNAELKRQVSELKREAAAAAERHAAELKDATEESKGLKRALAAESAQVHHASPAHASRAQATDFRNERRKRGKFRCGGRNERTGMETKEGIGGIGCV